MLAGERVVDDTHARNRWRVSAVEVAPADESRSRSREVAWRHDGDVERRILRWRLSDDRIDQARISSAERWNPGRHRHRLHARHSAHAVEHLLIDRDDAALLEWRCSCLYTGHDEVIGHKAGINGAQVSNSGDQEGATADED